ncbi:MAG TPA: PduL/EutD family phosphate acyltransferase, partial [Bacteroidota bacterium]|nr:PduL/EutD family phosphate acyltransferase [Bacteroidota bacterium]
MKSPGECACEATNAAPSHDALVDLIVREVSLALRAGPAGRAPGADAGSRKIPLGVSNRHIHLTAPTFGKLFGGNVEFERMRPLYQPGEFASGHTVTIVGPKLRSIPGVRILGPLRRYDQVEVSLTDAIFLGIDPPVVNSGTLDAAAPLTLVGPAGSVYLEKCAIIASRHIHMTNSDARVL